MLQLLRLESAQRLNGVIGLAQSLEQLGSTLERDVVFGNIDNLQNLVFSEAVGKCEGKSVLQQIG